MDSITEEFSKKTDSRARSPDHVDDSRLHGSHNSRISQTQESHDLHNVTNPDEQKADASLFKQYKNRNTYQQVLDLHDQLNHELHGMDSKYENVLHRKEKIFMEAYSKFMARTQHELKELKRKFELEDLKRQQSSHLVELENKMKLFRDEAHKLTEENVTMNKENNVLKAELKQLKIENEVLTQYIKAAAVKATKTRKSPQTQPNASFDASDLISRNKTSRETNSSPNKSFSYNRILSRNTTPGKVVRREMTQSREDIFSLSKVELDNLTPLERFERLLTEISQIKSTDLIIEKLDKNGRVIIMELDSKVNRMRKELEKQIKEKNELLRNKVESQLGDLENLFVDCVEQVRKDIFKRKVLLQQQNLNSLKSRESLQQGSVETSGQIGSKKDVGFEAFLMKDKQKLIELFLTNKDVLNYIYEGIFSRSLNRKFSKDSSFPNHSNRNLLNPVGDNSNLNLDTSKLLLMIAAGVPDEGALKTEEEDQILAPPKILGSNRSHRSRHMRNHSFAESRVAEKNQTFSGLPSNKTSLDMDGDSFSGTPDRRLRKATQPTKSEYLKNYHNPRNRVTTTLSGLGLFVQNK